MPIEKSNERLSKDVKVKSHLRDSATESKVKSQK